MLEKEDITKNLDVPFNLRERPKIRGERLLRGDTLLTVLKNLIFYLFLLQSKNIYYLYIMRTTIKRGKKCFSKKKGKSRIK